ncbi:MAG TPA: flavodoxin domain-containing protein [Clostridiales bacterium]|nr:flavodoxin domain-containing protein [Clostridiales bacterium]
MDRIAIVYWSGRGATKQMAEYVRHGIEAVGKTADVYVAADFNKTILDQYDKIAFGCPAMGNEELEPSEFEPMFNEIEPYLKDKKVVLFGSYGWGEQAWMKDWEYQIFHDGALLMDHGLAIQDEPDEEGRINCENLGTTLAIS